MGTTNAPHGPALFEHGFFFLRHGESVLNAQRRIAGSLDTELTARGHAQARHAGALLADRGIGAIYASPLQRARHTAQHVADALRLPLRLLPELAERHWGELEGRPLSARAPGVVPVGAETLDAFAERVLRGLGRIECAEPLVVAHSGVFRVLCRVLDLAQSQLPVSHALPVRFEPASGCWRTEPLG